MVVLLLVVEDELVVEVVVVLWWLEDCETVLAGTETEGEVGLSSCSALKMGLVSALLGFCLS